MSKGVNVGYCHRKTECGELKGTDSVLALKHYYSYFRSLVSDIGESRHFKEFLGNCWFN